ncbi:hypothetical protein [uncultured Pseudodesulfovibrio sp.]|uniref:alginate O-acetyltransferase AlgX-related protein n=1 Tax=uncultured Pseudodesulfovibrio sp. TaxID=2035858 RepID=UPI0029C7E53A|nr:hypothetical protein [uncultured Pseudodesulfovibrio sp.]
MKRFTAILARITIPVFLLLIFIPFIWSIPGVHGINLSRFEDMEKRSPNEYPALPTNRQELAAFPEAFEKAFNDHFGFRRDLITIFKLFKYNVFNQSTDPGNVVVGRDGWLYLGNDYFRTFDRHTGSRPPLEAEVDRLITAEKKKRQWLARRGIKYLFAAAPNKYSIYPEYLPAYVRSADNTVLLDLVAEKARKQGLPFIDLRPFLKEAKKLHGTLAYAKTDSHWSNLGAFYGYRALVEKLAEQTGPLKTLSLTGFEQSIGKAYNLEGLLGMRKFHKLKDVKIRLDFDHSSPGMKACEFSGKKIGWDQYNEVHYNSMLFIDNEQALNRLSIFMLRDSFTNRLSPLLNQTFTRMAYTHYNRPILPGNIVDFMLTFKPQVLLHEMVEVNLAGVTGVYPPWETPAVAPQEAVLLWPELGPSQNCRLEQGPDNGTWDITVPAADTRSVLLKIDLTAESDATLTAGSASVAISKGTGTYYFEMKPGTKKRLTFKGKSGAVNILTFEARPMSEEALRKLYRPEPVSGSRKQ